MDYLQPDVRDIARSTGATHWQIWRGSVRLFKFDNSIQDHGWKVGNIENGVVVWSRYPSEPVLATRI